jgi:hypothetical protein
MYPMTTIASLLLIFFSAAPAFAAQCGRSIMGLTMKRVLLSAALIAALALLVSPAAWAQGCTVTLPGGATKTFSLPCPPTSENDTGIADRVLAGVPQTARDLETSYNCFFYVQTNILGHTPNGIDFHWGVDPRNGWLESHHEVPATDYFDDQFLTSHGYHFVGNPGDMLLNIYQPGDIILVPGQDNNVDMGEQYKHVAIVYGTNNGYITRIRQKFDPFNRVIDLTPAEFDATYRPQEVKSSKGYLLPFYRVYSHPPYVGQITVPTGTYRQNGALYATSQQIKIIVFSFTPDGAHLRGPINSRNGGLYVTADGIYHASGPSYTLLGLYDAQGRGRQFNQTISLYTCAGGSSGTAC